MLKRVYLQTRAIFTLAFYFRRQLWHGLECGLADFAGVGAAYRRAWRRSLAVFAAQSVSAPSISMPLSPPLWQS